MALLGPFPTAVVSAAMVRFFSSPMSLVFGVLSNACPLLPSSHPLACQSVAANQGLVGLISEGSCVGTSGALHGFACFSLPTALLSFLTGFPSLTSLHPSMSLGRSLRLYRRCHRWKLRRRLWYVFIFPLLLTTALPHNSPLFPSTHQLANM